MSELLEVCVISSGDSYIVVLIHFLNFFLLSLPLFLLSSSLFISLLIPSPPLSLLLDDLFGDGRAAPGDQFGDTGAPAEYRHPSGAPLALMRDRVDPLEMHPLPTTHTRWGEDGR